MPQKEVQSFVYSYIKQILKNRSVFNFTATFYTSLTLSTEATVFFWREKKQEGRARHFCK